MRKLIGVTAVAFAIFAVATRPADSAAVVQAGAQLLWSAASVLLDRLIELTR